MMEGKTKFFSKFAGILNIAAAILLLITIVFFFLAVGSGVLDNSGNSSEESSETTEQSSSETSDNSTGKEIAEAIFGGFALGLGAALLFVVILILLVPLGLVNSITGLVMGSHCLKAPPRTGAVVYSLILKIISVPIFGYAALNMFVLASLINWKTPLLFPGLIVVYLLILILAHVFEWAANRSALRD